MSRRPCRIIWTKGKLCWDDRRRIQIRYRMPVPDWRAMESLRMIRLLWHPVVGWKTYIKWWILGRVSITRSRILLTDIEFGLFIWCPDIEPKLAIQKTWICVSMSPQSLVKWVQLVPMFPTQSSGSVISSIWAVHEAIHLFQILSSCCAFWPDAYTHQRRSNHAAGGM